MKNNKIISISNAGFTIVNMALFPALPIYMSEISDNKFYIGLIFSIPILASCLMNFFWGAISDYFNDRKSIVLYSNILGSLFFFTIPYLDPFMCIIVRSFQVSLLTSSFLFIAEVSDHSTKRGKSIGDLFAYSNIGAVIGSLLYALCDLYGGFSNWKIFYFTCGAIYLISSFLLVLHKDGKLISQRSFSSLFDLKYFKLISFVLLCHFFLSFGNNTIMALFPVYLKGEMQTSHFEIGMLWVFGSVLSIFTFKLAGFAVERFGRRPVYIFSPFSYLVAAFFYVFFKNPLLLGLLWVLPLFSFFMLSGSTIITDITSRTERGRGMALFTSAGSLGAVAGGLFSGFLADIFSNMRYIFATSFIFFFIAIFYSFKTNETKNFTLD